MSCTMRWRTTSELLRCTHASPSMPVRIFSRPPRPLRPPRDVDLGGVAGDDGLRAEADPGEEHLHLLGRGVLGLVQDDERRVQGAAPHEGQRRHLHRAPLEQLGAGLEPDHVVQGVPQRAEVRVDLGHEVARQEPEPLAGLDRRAGEDDPVDLLGLERLHGHGHGQPALAGAGRAQTERDDVVAHRVDVALLPARLRADRASARRPQHLGGEHVGGPLVVTDHLDAAPHGRGIEAVALLDEDDEVLQERGHALGVRPLDGDLVAADVDGGGRERGFDGSEHLVSLPEQRGHEVVGRDRDLYLGAGQVVVISP